IAPNPMPYWFAPATLDYESRPSVGEPFAATFTNIPPNEYWLFVDATNAAGLTVGTSTNHLRIYPANDNFAEAKQIVGWGAVEAFTLAGASIEPNEPLLAD